MQCYGKYHQYPANTISTQVGTWTTLLEWLHEGNTVKGQDKCTAVNEMEELSVGVTTKHVK